MCRVASTIIESECQMTRDSIYSNDTWYLYAATIKHLKAKLTIHQLEVEVVESNEQE
jgi:hypothetical protein